MFIEYRWTRFEKFTWYLANTSSFLDIYFVDQFSYSVCVCWFEIKINVVLWSVFSDTVYARVVVFKLKQTMEKPQMFDIMYVTWHLKGKLR
jgi:hypothetical protein